MQAKTSTTSRLANTVGKNGFYGLGSNMRLVWMGGNKFYELMGWSRLGQLHAWIKTDWNGVDAYRRRHGPHFATDPSRS